MAPKTDLVQDAKQVAGMASQGHVTEEFAARYLADIVGHLDVPRLKDAAIEAKNDPDAIPLVVALLERAAELAANPPERRVRATPDTRHVTVGY
ncbi:MAG TPA: hypothetical protein VGO89_21940 [Streptomyces sp.]|nr:hypothetical protein [Streptomyces sp.]